MREIKFRLWSDYTKMMYYSHRPGGSDNPLWSWDTVFRKRPDAHIMQYIGIKDKNGKEIYEGDIMKWTPSYAEPCILTPIIYDEAYLHYFASSPNNCPQARWMISEVEVIGNIYENPELQET